MRKNNQEAVLSRESLRAPALMQEKYRIRRIAKIAILGAIAFIFMLLEFPVPLMPVFLKFDFGEIPALLAGFAMGPLAAVAVELIKNVLHLPFTNTMMVGEAANFIVGSSFVVTAAWIYRRNKSKRSAMIGMLAATLVLTLVGALFNYFVNIPFFVQVMGVPLEAIFGMSQAAGNRMVHDLPSLILWVFVPFNILKGALISLLTGLSYKALSPLLHR